MLKQIKDAGNPNKRFLQFWCLKESIIKAIGKGLYIKLKDIEFYVNTDTNTIVLGVLFLVTEKPTLASGGKIKQTGVALHLGQNRTKMQEQSTLASFRIIYNMDKVLKRISYPTNFLDISTSARINMAKGKVRAPQPIHLEINTLVIGSMAAKPDKEYCITEMAE